MRRLVACRPKQDFTAIWLPVSVTRFWEHRFTSEPHAPVREVLRAEGLEGKRGSLIAIGLRVIAQPDVA